MNSPIKATPALAESDKEAEDRANEFFEKDPFPRVKPSLLSASEIVDYVEKTALIYPFDPSDELLKHASYEGRIGDKAFYYNNDGALTLASISDGFLTVPNNSIVFVESNITFRLPRYIGLRFNLQIKHVHRGILLGTGPLIDPGFRGKLLIPLHNLTSEPYHIKIDDGLIWIEFTKTTYNQTLGRKYGTFPERKNISDVEKWLRKAELCAKTGKRVPIRSSIPLLVEKANKHADAALENSIDAKTKSEDTRKKFFSFGLWGAIGGVGAFLALVTAFGIVLYQQYASQSQFIATIHPDFAAIATRLDATSTALEELERQASELQGRIAPPIAQAARSDERMRRIETSLDALSKKVDGWEK
ncbi:MULTISPECIES: hypothetical protein [Mesorhizobium]|uniref:hypothetical protein n=1 Tax=Mesorhizobium sp. TaxID=1871066 RepID=UPI000494D89F|nr:MULTISPECIES: hypothetical protein [Mesorhizobium]RWM71594.1 MAG: hypothetical protein EOR82_17360 [Mesorhizobium sp.]TIO24761.1 MAG: hypothetical protein E5X83_15990 [Mesorhizobium sp.]TJV56060.1 MAG: hypothetical protein E5X82_25130 [Mesorhizobium sp.]